MSLTVEITGVAYGGSGIGRINNKVVFTPFTAPGDVAEIEIIEDKKDFSIAKLIGLKEASKMRTSSPCPVYMICGGCQMQHIEYGQQVRLKEKIFVETFQRLAKTDLTPVLNPALASPKPFNYRSRVRFHRAGKKWGFFKPNSHSIVEIQDCPLLEHPLNSALLSLKATEFPDTLYEAEVSLDKQSGKTVAAFSLNKNTPFDWNAAINKIPLIKGFEVWVKDPFKRGRGRMVITQGDTRVSYKAGDFIISSGVSSFSQANLFQNERLAEAIVEFSGLTKNDDAFDLFCGAGNFTFPLSEKARMVYGSDTDHSAIKNARQNALKNNVSNVEFSIESSKGRESRAEPRPMLRMGTPHNSLTAASDKQSTGFIDSSRRPQDNLEKRAPSVVILDPPRGGAFETIKKLPGLEAEKIVYVSCAPPTMARDCAFLIKHGYTPDFALAVDMFPQTYHVEGVVAFKRGN